MTKKPKALLGICSNCDRERPIKVRSRSLCGTCANKLGRDPSRAQHRKYESSTCAVQGCDRPRHIREWCTAHGSRVNRYGDPRADIPIRERTGRVLRNGRNGTKYYALWKPEHPLAHSSGYVMPTTVNAPPPLEVILKTHGIGRYVSPQSYKSRAM